jgi:taurine dioxygenase
VLELRPLSDALGVEVVGVDLAAPPDPETVAEIVDAWLRHHLVLFRGQQLSADDQVRVATWFGEIDTQSIVMRPEDTVMYISNDPEVGPGGDGALLLHSDFCFRDHPLRALSLYGVEVPPQGGGTVFANAERAYEKLPESLRLRLHELHALHTFDYRRTGGGGRITEADLQPESPRKVRPAIWIHPDTGHPILYVNELMTTRFVELPDDESSALLDEVAGYFRGDDVVYVHEWQPNDLVVWDNRSLQHGRTDFEPTERRTLRRVPVKGGAALSG